MYLVTRTGDEVKTENIIKLEHSELENSCYRNLNESVQNFEITQNKSILW